MLSTSLSISLNILNILIKLLIIKLLIIENFNFSFHAGEMVYFSFHVCKTFLREPLVRQGFLSLQLLVNDFLPLIHSTCIAQCVEVTGGFGLQRAELNISLTAVGLLVSTVISLTAVGLLVSTVISLTAVGLLVSTVISLTAVGLLVSTVIILTAVGLLVSTVISLTAV